MRSAIAIAIASLAASSLLSACGGETVPTEQEQALTDPGSETRAGDHPVVLAEPGPGQANVSEGPITPAEQNDVGNMLRGQGNAASPQGDEGPSQAAQSAVTTVRAFASALEQRDFAQARRHFAGGGQASGLSEEQFARRFDGFRTIQTAVQLPRRVEGGSGQQQVQLTLHGELEGGEPYSRTGLVTLAPGQGGQSQIIHVRLGPTPPNQLQQQVAGQNS